MDTKQRKMVFVVIGAAIVLAIAGGLAALFMARNRQPSVTSFQQCVDQGYPVTGVNPRKCTGPNGVEFSESQAEENNKKPTNDTTQQPAANPPIQNDDGQTLALAVYFSKEPESLDDFTYTRAVTRNSDRADMGTYTIEQLIAGPANTEVSQGLFSPLKGKLQGESNCGGKDFALAVSERIARLRFCREIVSGGVGDDARITSTISDTLEQFSSVDSVIILTRDGNCFGDLSGQNQCLN